MGLLRRNGCGSHDNVQGGWGSFPVRKEGMKEGRKEGRKEGVKEGTKEGRKKH